MRLQDGGAGGTVNNLEKNILSSCFSKCAPLQLISLCQPKPNHRLKILNAAWNSSSAGYSGIYFGSLNGELGCKGNAVLGDGPGCWCLEHRLDWGSSSWLGCCVCSPAGCSCKHSPVVSIFLFCFCQRTGAYALTQPSSTLKKFPLYHTETERWNPTKHLPEPFSRSLHEVYLPSSFSRHLFLHLLLAFLLVTSSCLAFFTAIAFTVSS